MYFKVNGYFVFGHIHTWMYISHFLLDMPIPQFFSCHFHFETYHLIIIVVHIVFIFYPNTFITLIYYYFGATLLRTVCHRHSHFDRDSILMRYKLFDYYFIIHFSFFDLQIGEQTMKAIIPCSCAICWCYGDH